MSDAVHKVVCESCQVYFNVVDEFPDAYGIPTYTLACPRCGGTTAVQDVPDAAFANQAVVAPCDEFDTELLLPKALSADDTAEQVELEVVQDDVDRPDGRAESEFYERSDKAMSQDEQP